MINQKLFDKIEQDIRTLANRHPDLQFCLVIGSPCHEHAGAHLDIASLGHQDLTALVDAAISQMHNVSPTPTLTKQNLLN